LMRLSGVFATKGIVRRGASREVGGAADLVGLLGLQTDKFREFGYEHARRRRALSLERASQVNKSTKAASRA